MAPRCHAVLGGNSRAVTNLLRFRWLWGPTGSVTRSRACVTAQSQEKARFDRRKCRKYQKLNVYEVSRRVLWD